MQKQTPTARAFFQANKDLFQYEKHMGARDPFPGEEADDQADGDKPFLEQYREIDRDHLPTPTFTKLRFSLLHPSAHTRSIATLAANISAAAPWPEFVTLQSTASVLQNLNNAQTIPSQAFATSPQRASHHAQQQHRSLTTNESALAQQYSSPDRYRVSASTTISNDHIESAPLQRQRSPARVPVILTESGTKLTDFYLPKLTELLIDRETRAAATAHKSWDEAHKIEVLVGGKCVGRMSAASRNIPPSIRSRLRASANVSVRRERLYELLRKDYDELSKRCTQ